MASLRCFFSKPQIAGRVGAHGLAILGRPPVAAAAATSPPMIEPMISISHHQQQQVRTKITKTKRRQGEKILERERRVAMGLPAKRNPPRYIPKDTPVIGAMTREERDDESRRFDAAAAEEMKVKIAEQSEKEENLRFQFDGLVMSDRVRKLFELRNGSQAEVVKSQKRRGMEVRR